MISYSVIAEKSLTTSRYLAIIAAIAAPASTAITGIACIAMLITWLISGQAWQTVKISAQQPIGKALLLFFAWLILSSFYADTDLSAKLTTLSSWKKLFYTFVLLGIFYPTEWKRKFIVGYLAAMTVGVLVSTVLWLLHLNLKGWGEGIFMTNYSSQSLAFIAGIVCCIFLYQEITEVRKKYLLLGLIGLFLLNVFFISPSRSGYLALPVAVVFAFISFYGYKKIPHILAVTVVVLGLAIATSGTLQQRIKLGLQEKNNYQTSSQVTSIGIRMVYAQNTWELIQEKPLQGYGTSSFKKVFSEHVAKKYHDWRGESAADPHNQYLFVWLENGLLGLALFLAYIVTAVKQGVSQKPYGVVGASFLLAISATSLFNSNFKTFPEGHLLAFFVGCLLANHSSDALLHERQD